MATTYKLYSAANTDGVVYIDLPISGRLSAVAWTCALSSGAGGPGGLCPELSRVAVNQVAVSNPRGVISSIRCATAAASQSGAAQRVDFPNEPVKSGERLYLNCAGGAANFAAIAADVFLTIE